MLILTISLTILTALMIIIGKVRNFVSWSWPVFTGLSAVLLGGFGHYYPIKPEAPWHGIAVILWCFSALYVARNINRPNRTKPIMVIMTIALIAIAIITNFFAPPIVVITPKKAPIQAPTQQVKKAIDPKVLDAKAVEALVLAGFTKKDAYNAVHKVNLSKDKSTAGQYAFNAKGIKSTSQMVDYLKNSKNVKKSDNSVSASALLSYWKKDGYLEDELLNPGNWKILQPQIAYYFNGNTGFKNGKIINVGRRKAKAGDTLLIFVSSTSGKILIVRAGCANTQTAMPTPEKTKPPKQKLTQKSSNPKDYKKPGDDKKKDAGIGKKPIVAKVITPAEKQPPKVVEQVVTKVRGGQEIIDKPTNQPGSETGILAPKQEIDKVVEENKVNSNIDSAPTPPDTTTSIPTNEGGTNNGKVTDD